MTAKWSRLPRLLPPIERGSSLHHLASLGRNGDDAVGSACHCHRCTLLHNARETTASNSTDEERAGPGSGASHDMPGDG